MIDAIASVLNGHPAFEGIVLTQENALGDAGQIDPTYTHTGYVAGLQAVALHAKAAFPNGTVAINWNNRVAGMSEAIFNSMFDWMLLNAVAAGWPDSRPHCVGTCSSDPVTYAPASSQPNDHAYFHDNTHVGDIAIYGGIESSELGQATVCGNDCLGWTPDAKHGYHDGQGSYSHRLWIRGDFLPATPTGQLEWCWDQVAEACANGPPDYWILDEINLRTPDPAGQVCPSYYNGRCYTDAD